MKISHLVDCDNVVNGSWLEVCGFCTSDNELSEFCCDCTTLSGYLALNTKAEMSVLDFEMMR